MRWSDAGRYGCAPALWTRCGWLRGPAADAPHGRGLERGGSADDELAPELWGLGPASASCDASEQTSWRVTLRRRAACGARDDSRARHAPQAERPRFAKELAPEPELDGLGPPRAAATRSARGRARARARRRAPRTPSDRELDRRCQDEAPQLPGLGRCSSDDGDAAATPTRCVEELAPDPEAPDGSASSAACWVSTGCARGCAKCAVRRRTALRKGLERDEELAGLGPASACRESGVLCAACRSCRWRAMCACA